jgi:hypothetical protein
VGQHVAGLRFERIGEGFLGRTRQLLFHQIETHEKIGGCFCPEQQVRRGSFPDQFL